MLPTPSRKEPIDLLLFRRNRDEYPDEQLQPHWGKQAAWSGDGKTLIASAESHEALYKFLYGIGVDPTDVVVEFIPHPDVSYYG